MLLFYFVLFSYIIIAGGDTMIQIKELFYDEEAILHLYLDNKWSNYTDEKETLFQGIKHSLDCFGAYDRNQLVGLIRTIGDQHTIVYIQDILVLEAYQRQGIGRQLMETIIDKYKGIYQLLLTTDQSDKTISFYKSLGFESYTDWGATGFRYRK